MKLYRPFAGTFCVSILLLMIFLFGTIYSLPNNFSNQPVRVSPRSIKIRVLLREYDTRNNHSFDVDTNGGVIVQSVPQTKQGYHCNKKNLCVKIKKNELYFQEGKSRRGKALKDEMILLPKNGTVTINGMKCGGHVSLKLDVKRKKLYVINTLDLDDYVYSVLLYESYQTWPLGMQKVQAIVSRTYALHCMMANKRSGHLPYDIKNNNFHQRYRGTHNYNHLMQAVDETKNLVLTHNDKIVVSMFDACCGGVVPARIKGFNFEEAPYLARKKACHYCKKYKLYSWKGETTVKKFIDGLRSHGPLKKRLQNIGEVRGLKTKERDKAGVLHKFEIQGERRQVCVSGKEIWNAISGTFKSKCITMRKEKHRLFYWGKGFGHHIGLCQRGARELVRKGWGTDKILGFYYPGTKVKKLQVVLK
jgi:stage II sporulation protein D